MSPLSAFGCHSLKLSLGFFLCLFLLFLQLEHVLRLLSRIHASRLVNGINVSLIEINNKDDVISEAADTVHGRHRDDETEEVVDDRVQESVEEGFAGHVLHAFQPVVYVQLRSHVDEAEGVDASDQSVEKKGVQALVLGVEDAVDGVAT